MRAATTAWIDDRPSGQVQHALWQRRNFRSRLLTSTVQGNQSQLASENTPLQSAASTKGLLPYGLQRGPQHLSLCFSGARSGGKTATAPVRPTTVGRESVTPKACW